MNYYKRHIGDYAAKAGHLTPLEHGVYTLLLDAYYNREEAPTRAEAVRWARARSKEEMAAVDAVLAEFFVETDGRFIQQRVEEELAAFASRRETNRQLGAKGGKAKGKRFARDSLSEQEAKDKPSHKPLATSQEASIEASLESTDVDLSLESAAPDSEDDPPGMPKCPVKRIVALYHELLPELSPVLELPEQTVRMIRQRWRSSPERQSLDWWRDFFAYVRRCPFLMGEKTSFTADLLWLVKPTNFAKVINGNYQERAA